MTDQYEDWADDLEFANPGSNSALRAATKGNPRNNACPTCLWPDRLTRADVQLGYQCDQCADAMESGGEIDFYDQDEDPEGALLG